MILTLEYFPFLCFLSTTLVVLYMYITAGFISIKTYLEGNSRAVVICG